ncbi:MAG: GTPase HflX [Thermoanaerobacterales bacterium]|nr:GTPase HflX [Thermoanaerobacterales bacterium]
MALIDRSFREKIVVVGVTIPPETVEETEASLDELELLIDTAGADVVARVQQRRTAPDPPTYVGRGKAEELREVALATDCDTVVFDNELTPAQQYNLEKLLGRTAIDRTAVILDIFAQNAHSQEGKAQVELAQLRYRLPRLRRQAGALSQQAGGMSAAGGAARIGTRGPGETQLEVDRRRIVRRIHKLEADLRDIERHRRTQRKARRRGQLAKVVIVGYTNAGKSTLLNRLTDAGVLVEDRLFATLDATTRRLSLPGGETVLLTDTVGFIRKLPHQLVEAFRSTLDVAVDADLLVHVVDASAPDVEGNIRAVRTVLCEIGADRVPELLAFNKADLAPEAAERLREEHEGSVALSAVTGQGVDRLLATIGDRLRAMTTVLDLVIPFDRGDLLAAAHRAGEVLHEEPGEGGMHLRGRFDDATAGRFREYVVST